MYKRYGQPNDLLVTLNVYDFKVRDVHIEPVYNIGEKYIIRNFHPLVFFYLLGNIFGIATIILFGRGFYRWYITGRIPPINALSAMFCFMSLSLFTLFAMWFDMEKNKDLK